MEELEWYDNFSYNFSFNCSEEMVIIVSLMGFLNLVPSISDNVFELSIIPFDIDHLNTPLRILAFMISSKTVFFFC